MIRFTPVRRIPLPAIVITALIRGLIPEASASDPGATANITQRWVQGYHHAQASVYQKNIKAVWHPDGETLIYPSETRKGLIYLQCDAITGKKTEPFSHQQAASSINKKLGTKFTAHNLPLRRIQWIDKTTADKHQSTLIFRINEQWFQAKDGAVSPHTPAAGQTAQKSTKKSKKGGKGKNKKAHKKSKKGASPDGQWLAQITDNGVALKHLRTGETKHLADTPQKGSYFKGKALWNKNSTYFALTMVQPGQRRMVQIVESSPKGKLEPTTHSFRYDKPGDRIDRTEPVIFNISNNTQHRPSIQRTADAFELGHLSWNSNDSELLYEYVERGFGKHHLIALHAETGKERILTKEESNSYVFVSGTRYRHQLDETNEIIWASERDGWRHLYLIDSLSGKIKNQITQGEWIVRSIEKIDVKNRQIIFQASGKNHDQDPYHLHWYRINFDGQGLTELTQGDGMHSLQFSPDKKYYIDTWSRVDQPPVYELHRTRDGKKITELARADASQLIAQGHRLPQRFVCKDRNGRFDIWGVIFTPPHFDPKKKYPVIENIYSGPHGAFVPKHFQPWHGHISELVEEGFIVVKIDGLGTNYRHHDFSHFCYKNLVDAGLPDRIKWIKEAAQQRPYMDIHRVGIYGGSAGGQSSTAAVLHHGEFYKAAVSDCGCHDNRMDKIWWNEQWMDWPIGPHYQDQANASHAHRLSGALMLTVGEMDKNVDPASTTQLVKALIKSDKDFDYHILPGAGHGAGEHPYLRRLRCEFFQKHLGSAH